MLEHDLMMPQHHRPRPAGAAGRWTRSLPRSRRPRPGLPMAQARPDPGDLPADHRLSLDRAQVLEWRGEEICGGGVTRGGAQTSGGAVSSGGAQIAGAAVTKGGGHNAGGAVTRGGAQIAGLADTGGGGVSAGGGVSRGGAGIRGEAWTSVSGAAASCGVFLLVSGMMIAPALAAARVLRAAGAVTVIVNIPVIKPLDTATALSVAR